MGCENLSNAYQETVGCFSNTKEDQFLILRRSQWKKIKGIIDELDNGDKRRPYFLPEGTFITCNISRNGFSKKIVSGRLDRDVLAFRSGNQLTLESLNDTKPDNPDANAIKIIYENEFNETRIKKLPEDPKVIWPKGGGLGFNLTGIKTMEQFINLVTRSKVNK